MRNAVAPPPWDVWGNGHCTPSQIDMGLEMFSPSRERLDEARKLEAAYAQAEASGVGAVKVDGVMVDAATIRLLRASILDKGQLYGM